MSENLIEVRGLVKTFEAPRLEIGFLGRLGDFFRNGDGDAGEAAPPDDQRIRAVDGLSFSIEAGKVLGLVGESGCGKSTVARCLLRLIEADEGDVLFEGKSIFSFGGEDLLRFRRQAQIVFQNPMASMDPRYTVQRIVAEPLRVHKLAEGEDRMRRIHELLEAVHLRVDHMERYPHQLSGGERQRVLIARALATSPKLLVLDEPTSALDVSARTRIIRLLQELKEAYNMTYLVISHDLSIIRHLSDRVVVMYLGRAMAEGPTERVIEEPRHPYTEALMSSIPIPEPGVNRARIRLKGEVSRFPGQYTGCPLANRCHRAVEECHVRPQRLEPISDNRQVACHRVSEGQI